jgi:hypothetical protein
LHAIILILGVVTISFCSILNDACLTMNVHTSSHSRYVFRWPWADTETASAAECEFECGCGCGWG